MLPATTTIEVTQDCISNGRRKSTGSCPVALALSSHFQSTIYGVNIQSERGDLALLSPVYPTVLSNSSSPILRYSITFGPKLRARIRNYDRGYTPKPFSVILDTINFSRSIYMEVL